MRIEQPICLVPVFAGLIAEWMWARSAFKNSSAVGYIPCSLIAMQLLAGIYILTAPETLPNAADLGGANLGPPIVLALTLGVTAMVLFTCAIGWLCTFISAKLPQSWFSSSVNRPEANKRNKQ